MNVSSPRSRWFVVSGLGAGLLAGLIVNNVWSQATDNKTPQAAKKEAKETAKDARDGVRDTKKDAREETRDARDEKRDTTREARDDVRDTKQGNRDKTREAGKEARDTTREARDGVRDTREEGRDKTRDARETARDAGRNARETTRDAREANRDDRRDARGSFQADSVRSPDIGLWFDRSAKDNLTISDVGSKGAIAKLGFKEGDRIVSVNDHKVTQERDFIRTLFADDIRNKNVNVVVMRGGKEQVIQVQPSVLVDEYAHVDNDPLEHFGIVLDDRQTNRIVVWKVLPRTPAYYAGIRAGDNIVSFKDQKVSSVKDFSHMVQTAEPGNVQVAVSRDSKIREFDVEVPQFEARSERQTVFRPNLDDRNGADRRDARQERREDRRDDRQERRDDRREDRK